ncbi:MAG: CRTAC1 family protein [Planctomycetales bacterium]
MKIQLGFLLLWSAAMLLALPVSAEEAPWKFADVTSKVIDRNPPGIGRIFDFAFLDVNDDNYLDIVVNNHDHSKPAPIWLGTADHAFKFWKNMPPEHTPGAGFYLGEVDLNGDGKTDVVYTGNEGGVVVNLNASPQGAHQPIHRPVALRQSSYLLAFADFNGDDKLEVLVRPGQMLDASLTKILRTDLHFGNSTVSDFNNDGWPDLFACGLKSRWEKWSGPRRLFKNNQGKLETVRGDSPLVTEYLAGIVRSGDFNNDGNMDLYVFDSQPTDPGDADGNHRMRLYLGDGDFGFTDVTEKAGVSNSKVKSGYSMVYLADVNNDTHLDIVNQGNYGCQCWKNNGDAVFTLVSKKEVPWAVNAHMRLDDYNMDGRLDVVTAAEGPGWKDRETTIRVFRNEIDNGCHWLKIQLRQSGSNTMAIGASVTVRESGTKMILGKRIVTSDTTGRHPRLHFGLAQHRRVDVEVRFPADKKIVRFADLQADRYVVLRPDGSVTDVSFGPGS